MVTHVWVCLCGSSDMILGAHFSLTEDECDVEMKVDCRAESHLKSYMTISLADSVCERINPNHSYDPTPTKWFNEWKYYDILHVTSERWTDNINYGNPKYIS